MHHNARVSYLYICLGAEGRALSDEHDTRSIIDWLGHIAYSTVSLYYCT